MSEVLEQVEHEDAAEDFRMVTFSLGRKAYGIDIMRVKEISSARRFTYVPNTVSYVRGVFNLRGEIIPVVDMRLFFDLEITGEKSELDITRNNDIYEDLIILTFDYINIGIIVDSISHVVSIDREMIQHSHPLFSELDVPYIEGIVNYNDQLYIILAMDRIIDPHLDSGEQISFDLEAAFIGGLHVPKREKQILAKQAPFVRKDIELSSESPESLESIDAGLGVTSPKEVSKGVTEEDIPDKSTPVDTEQNLATALQKEGIVLTPLNQKSVQEKWREWRRSKKTELTAEDLLESVHNRKEFLVLLQSRDHNTYWPAELRELLEDYFQNRKGNLNVWHAGCGNGQETYSIAAALVGAAPEANIQVRAADSDLLEVSEAPMQSVGAPGELPEWLRPYLNEERGKEGYSFAKVLKDRIIFEYQDVTHATPHTKADLIVMRDLLSRYPEVEQDYILGTVERSLTKEGLLIVGDDEQLDEEKWELLESKSLKIYRAKRLLS